MGPLMKRNYPYYMLIPGLFIYFVFFIAPSLGSFYYALTNWNGFTLNPEFIGLDNFRAFFDQSYGWLALNNTLLFAGLTSVLKVSLGLALAILVNQKLKTALYLRSMIFFPVILSTIAVAIVFSSIYHPTTGLLNRSLDMLGFEGWKQSWLADPSLVMYSIIAVEVWKWVGMNMILFLAGLQSLPSDLYESSSIDGATKWQQFVSITIPLIVPVINLNVILGIIGGMKVFELVYAMTSGGPGYSSSVMNTIVFDNFTMGRFGEATAANLILFLIILLLALATYRIISRYETEV